MTESRRTHLTAREVVVAKKAAELQRKKSTQPEARRGQARASRRASTLADAEVSEGPQFGRKNLVLLGLAVGTIILGYVSLAFGDITLAPILLVLGYAVLVPWAILAPSRPDTSKRASSSGG
jgi:hypothetical protein